MLLCLNLKTQISHASELAIDSMCQIDSQRYLHFFSLLATFVCTRRSALLKGM